MRKTSFEELARYYQRGNGFITFQKFSQKKHSSWLGFLIVFLIVLILVLLASLAGFLIFGHQVIELKNENILVEIQGPDEIEAGQTANFSILIKNKERVELKDVELSLNFPADFYLEETSELCVERFASGCVWMLGKMARTERKSIEFKGYFLSPSAPESSSKLVVSLNFQMVGLSANFKKQIEKTVTVVPILSLDLNFPTPIFLGQEISWEVIINNKIKNEIKNLEIKLEAPSDFSFSLLTTDDQSLVSGSGSGSISTWVLPVLRPNEKKSLFLRGYFEEAGEKVLKVEALLSGANGRSFSQGMVQKTLLVEPSNFNCQFAGEHNLVVGWDEIVPLTFTYENQSQDDFEDVFFKLSFDQPEYIDWSSSLKAGWQWQGGEKNISTNFWQVSEEGQKKILIWQASQIPALKQIKVGERGEIKIFLKLIHLTEVLEDYYQNLELKIDLEASGAWQEGTRVFFKAKPIKIKIKTSS
jgi:hypothetical protein